MKNLSTWNERLAYALSIKNETPAALSRACKVRPPSVSQWLDGTTKELKSQNAERACAFLKINIRWLLYGIEPMDVGPQVAQQPEIPPGAQRHQSAFFTPIYLAESPPNSPYNVETIKPGRGVPIIDWQEAGNWRDTVDNFSAKGKEGSLYIGTNIEIGRHTYALRVKDDTMSDPGGQHDFPKGAVIVCEPEAEARHESFVIVDLGNGDTTFKQLVIDAGVRYLKPLNQRYQAREMPAGAIICGVVREMLTSKIIN